ncbi:MAG: radical SAM protein [Candidatus Kaelpia aquatica]|nr:radical SAM protein [Candidatus Kaelpia aquatica]
MNLKLKILRSRLLKQFIRWGLTDVILDLYWSGNNKSSWKEIKSSGYIDKPRSVWFEPTMRCNLSCDFCHQSRRRGLNFSELGIKEIEKFLNHIKDWGLDLIEMVGGEIFIREDIFEILDLIEAREIKVKLGTNGYLLDQEKVEKLKTYKYIESIAVSIDADRERHNNLRKSGDSFQRAYRALEWLCDAPFIVGLYAVIIPENVDSIGYLVDLASKLKVDRLTFMPEMFYSEGDIKEASDILNFNQNDSFFIQQKELSDKKAYLQKSTAAIHQIISLRRRGTVFTAIYPRITAKDPLEFFQGQAREEKNLICKHLHSLTVIENGDVLICPFIYKKIGNITKDSLLELWDSKIMQNLRKDILNNNLLPICKRCCSLDYI